MFKVGQAVTRKVDGLAGVVTAVESDGISVYIAARLACYFGDFDAFQPASEAVQATLSYEAKLAAAANRMFDDQLDYVEVDETMLYSYMRNGSFEVWSVDPMDSCNMEDAIQLFLVKSYKMGV